MASAPYCGEMRVRAAPFLTRNAQGGLPRLLAGRRVGYCFSTRVGIRKACDLLGLTAGDEVLAPAYNCGSELDPLLHAGLTVTLVPVDRATLFDLGALEAMIGARTRAIYLIHYFGVLHPQAADLRSLCDRHGLALIEDCALSLLSGTHPAEGRWGDVALFCFYKFFPMLAGGALVLNAPHLPGEPDFPVAPRGAVQRRHLLRSVLLMVPGVEQRLRKRRLAKGRPDTAPHLPDMPGSYYFDPGLIGMGVSGVDRRAMAGFDVADAIRARRAHYHDYQRLLADLPGARPLFPELEATSVPLSMPVVVQDRDRIAAQMQAQGIGVTPWWAGYHRRLDFSGQDGARFLKDHVLALPVHQDLGPGAAEHVVAVLKACLSPGSSGPTADPGPSR